MKKGIKLCFLSLLMLFLTTAIIFAESVKVTKPHTFVKSQSAKASEVNQNFDVAYEYIQKLVDTVCRRFPQEEICHGLDTFTNDIGMTFVLIKPGIFMMGSPSDELGRGSNETQQEVTFTEAYYMQTTEVTQGQWKAVMESNPSHFSSCGDDCPVETVSWDDVQIFIEKMNQKEGSDKYRLPTETEWEYAARAGTTTAFANGEISGTGCGIEDNLNAMGWYCGNADSKTHTVAQKLSNAWGLFDMHGNVFEWCQDWALTGSYRSLRGGCWSYSAKDCRSATRSADAPNKRSENYGLRLLRTP